MRVPLNLYSAHSATMEASEFFRHTVHPSFQPENKIEWSKTLTLPSERTALVGREENGHVMTTLVHVLHKKRNTPRLST